MAAPHAEFNAYLDRPGADPYADLVGYRQGVLWLSKDEMTELIGEQRAAVAADANDRPAPGRSPRLMSLIQFPIDEALQQTAGRQATTTSESGAQRRGQPCSMKAAVMVS